MMRIKEHLLLIGTSSPCSGSSRFPLLLSEQSFTMCSMGLISNSGDCLPEVPLLHDRMTSVDLIFDWVSYCPN